MEKNSAELIPITLYYWSVGGLAGGLMLIATALSLYVKSLQSQYLKINQELHKEYSKEKQENLIMVTEEATKSRIALEQNTKLHDKIFDHLTKNYRQ